MILSSNAHPSTVIRRSLDAIWAVVWARPQGKAIGSLGPLAPSMREGRTRHGGSSDEGNNIQLVRLSHDTQNRSHPKGGR